MDEWGTLSHHDILLTNAPSGALAPSEQAHSDHKVTRGTMMYLCTSGPTRAHAYHHAYHHVWRSLFIISTPTSFSLVVQRGVFLGEQTSRKRESDSLFDWRMAPPPIASSFHSRHLPNFRILDLTARNVEDETGPGVQTTRVTNISCRRNTSSHIFSSLLSGSCRQKLI